MEQAIQTTLKRWESSLLNYGKVDQWSITEDYATMASFISSCDIKAARKAVRECRDYAMTGSCKADYLLSLVQNANNILSKSMSGIALYIWRWKFLGCFLGHHSIKH